MKTTITIPAVPVEITAKVDVPEDAIGLVVLVFSRQKYHLCDRLVLDEAHNNNFGTVTVELLTAAEAVEDQRRFNVELLTERLIAVTKWLQDHPLTRSLSLAFYARGDQATTILRTAAGLKHQIKALITVGGDVQAALPVLYQITAPVLFIVGEDGDQIIKVSKDAMEQLKTQKSMKIITHSDQSFTNPLSASEVATITAKWLKKYLTAMSRSDRDMINH